MNDCPPLAGTAAVLIGYRSRHNMGQMSTRFPVRGWLALHCKPQWLHALYKAGDGSVEVVSCECDVLVRNGCYVRGLHMEASYVLIPGSISRGWTAYNCLHLCVSNAGQVKRMGQMPNQAL